MSSVPYTGGARAGIPGAEELRARIPGWGADLDPADRPSVPRELTDGRPDGVHWDVPDDQPERTPRERSIEHARLTPVFGTTCPPRGVSGAIRKVAYARYSEGRAAHWLLLLAADRVESKAAAARSMLSRRPDNPVTETGVVGELRRGGLSSRFGRGRVDTVHHPADAVIVALPWAASAGAVYVVARRLLRRSGVRPR
jgi:hypothetical protein